MKLWLIFWNVLAAILCTSLLCVFYEMKRGQAAALIAVVMIFAVAAIIRANNKADND